MIDIAAKDALSRIISILDEHAEMLSQVVEGSIFDETDEPLTKEYVISAINDLLFELPIQFLKVTETLEDVTLKEVVPSNEESEVLA